MNSDKGKRAAVTLGRTGITVNKNGFGALPIQRLGMDEAIELVRRAYEGGITFFNSSRKYTDSEEKLGRALSDVRDKVILATKTSAKTGTDQFWRELETSLKMLRTDYIDVYQFHNITFCPKPGHQAGLYEAMVKAKEQGMIRWIGMSNHRPDIAEEAIESGLYDTMQYPFSLLSDEPEHRIVRLCKERNMGFIAMKGLAGGLLTNARAAYAFMAGYDHVLPIWGIQHQKELDEFLSFIDSPPAMTPELEAEIHACREEIKGNFCRACMYCQPCPAGIPIHFAARMGWNLEKSDPYQFITPEWQDKMALILTCTNCGACKTRCPYELDCPELLRKNFGQYKAFLNRPEYRTLIASDVFKL